MACLNRLQEEKKSSEMKSNRFISEVGIMERKRISKMIFDISGQENNSDLLNAMVKRLFVSFIRDDPFRRGLEFLDLSILELTKVYGLIYLASLKLKVLVKSRG